MNFVKFLTTPFSQNTSRHLVLIAGFNPGQTWVLFSYGFSKTQITWIKQGTRATLPNLAGPLKKVPRKQGFLWSCWVCCQGNYAAGFTVGSRTQLTQVTWVEEPSLPSLTGLIKKLDFSWVHLNK